MFCEYSILCRCAAAAAVLPTRLSLHHAQFPAFQALKSYEVRTVVHQSRNHLSYLTTIANRRTKQRNNETTKQRNNERKTNNIYETMRRLSQKLGCEGRKSRDRPLYFFGPHPRGPAFFATPLQQKCLLFSRHWCRNRLSFHLRKRK